MAGQTCWLGAKILGDSVAWPPHGHWGWGPGPTQSPADQDLWQVPCVWFNILGKSPLDIGNRHFLGLAVSWLDASVGPTVPMALAVDFSRMGPQ